MPKTYLIDKIVGYDSINKPVYEKRTVVIPYKYAYKDEHGKYRMTIKGTDPLGDPLEKWFDVDEYLMRDEVKEYDSSIIRQFENGTYTIEQFNKMQDDMANSINLK